MQFLLILAVLASLMAADQAGLPPVGNAKTRWMAAGDLIVLYGALIWLVCLRFAGNLRSNIGRRQEILGRFGRWRILFLLLWLALAALIAGPLQWGRIVRTNWGLGRLPLIDDLLVMLPVVLPLLLSWAAFYEIDRALRQKLGREAWSRAAYVLYQVRQQLGLVLVPLLILIAIDDTVEWLAPDARGLALLAWMTIPAGLLLLMLPFLLRVIWPMQPLPPGPLRQRLREICARMGLKVRDILVWQTSSTMANAAVVGVFGWHRYVFLSDVLLRELNAEEVEATFAHEAGHVAHHHVCLRLLAVISPLFLVGCLELAAPGSLQRLLRYLHDPFAELLDMPLFIVLGLGAYLFLVFAVYSRRLEHQADLFSALALAGGDSPEARDRGAGIVAGALGKTGRLNHMSPSSRSWQHPSIDERIAFLGRMLADPASIERFQRNLRLAAIGLWIIAAAGISGWVVALIATPEILAR